MKRSLTAWQSIALMLIDGTPLFQRISRATSKSLNAKAINHQKMTEAELKRQRKQAKRLGVNKL